MEQQVYGLKPKGRMRQPLHFPPLEHVIYRCRKP